MDTSRCPTLYIVHVYKHTSQQTIVQKLLCCQMIYKTRTHILCVRHKTESKQCYTSGPLIPVDTWTPAVLLFKRLILKTLWKMKVQSGLRRERPSDRPGDYSNRTLAPDYPLGTPAQLCISRYVPKHYIILPLYYFHFRHPTVEPLRQAHNCYYSRNPHKTEM